MREGWGPVATIACLLLVLHSGSNHHLQSVSLSSIAPVSQSNFFCSLPFNHVLAPPPSFSPEQVNTRLIYNDLNQTVWVKRDLNMEKGILDIIIPSWRTFYCLSPLGPRSCPQIARPCSFLQTCFSSSLIVVASHFQKLLSLKLLGDHSRVPIILLCQVIQFLL